jgi:hypothetical protein
MPPTAEPPALPTAVAAPPADFGSKAAAVAAKAAKTTIAVSDLPKPVEPPKPPKPGTARARLYDQMQKQFGGVNTPAAGTEGKPQLAGKSPTEDSPPTGSDPRDRGTGEPEASPASGSPTAEAPPTPAPTPDDTTPGKKLSPWKLVDQFKERATKAEARALELEKLAVPEEVIKQSKAKLEELETKVKEMTEELRYTHAEKYDPAIAKAKEDYNKSFTRAMKELKSVMVTDPVSKEPRPLTVNDLAELAFMDLGQATQVAKEVFGELAPYVMDHRNEIRRLWDGQQEALEELKKTGSAREQQRMEEMRKASEELGTFINQTYTQANKEATEDPHHGHLFKPREGDDEWNSRLEKGFKLVDEAMASGPFDPKLTREQRTEIVRKHAAIRNRAAAFGPLRHRVEVLEKQLADAKSELSQYKETTPPAGGRTSAPVTEKKRGMVGLLDDLQKIAH